MLEDTDFLASGNNEYAMNQHDLRSQTAKEDEYLLSSWKVVRVVTIPHAQNLAVMMLLLSSQNSKTRPIAWYIWSVGWCFGTYLHDHT